MKILIIEPFFTGSHKDWAEGFMKFSSHTVKIISLPGRFWKWRMHGGAITLAKQFNKLKFKPDIILSTDMLNLPVFKSLINIKCLNYIYFHENQFTYPWSPNDPDVELQRDKHYGFINYSSTLCADHIYFNSKFHLDSFFIGLEKFLKQFPDYREMHNINTILNKCSILHLGMNLTKFNNYKTKKNKTEPLAILWNHRWEHDKNPESFFNILNMLSKNKLDFNLIILGKQYKKSPTCFIEAQKNLSKHIIHFGYVESFKEYAYWLWKADILPITSNQDFFGASIMEAVYCNTIPILPKRLTYPELFKLDVNSDIFYNNETDLLKKIVYSCQNITVLRKKNYQNIAKDYDWLNIVKIYDEELKKFN